mmetsp:Transcript_28944/g.62991  ORF Transcript_28944/g.62991 Transcript_28944/m.62991 type:complete len:280 (+) Transcript_28944:1539-2378(+)
METPRSQQGRCFSSSSSSWPSLNFSLRSGRGALLRRCWVPAPRLGRLLKALMPADAPPESELHEEELPIQSPGSSCCHDAVRQRFGMTNESSGEASSCVAAVSAEADLANAARGNDRSLELAATLCVAESDTAADLAAARGEGGTAGASATDASRGTAAVAASGEPISAGNAGTEVDSRPVELIPAPGVEELETAADLDVFSVTAARAVGAPAPSFADLAEVRGERSSSTAGTSAADGCASTASTAAATSVVEGAGPFEPSLAEASTIVTDFDFDFFPL